MIWLREWDVDDAYVWIGLCEVKVFVFHIVIFSLHGPSYTGRHLNVLEKGDTARKSSYGKVESTFFSSFTLYAREIH